MTYAIFLLTDYLQDKFVHGYIIHCMIPITLQKQVGCFNHRVVALVADKLERQWLLEVCFDVED